MAWSAEKQEAFAELKRNAEENLRKAERALGSMASARVRWASEDYRLLADILEELAEELEHKEWYEARKEDAYTYGDRE